MTSYLVMKLIRFLKYASLVYLLIPSLLFLLTWLHLGVGVIASFFIVIFVIKYIYQEQSTSCREVSRQYEHWWHIILMLLLSLLVNIILGIGEFKRQESDFVANNFKYYDLINHEWPLYYNHYKVHMCYYLGYYLPVAQLSKWFSIDNARYFALAWSALGLFFVFLWISTFIKRNGILLVLLFIIFPNGWLIYAAIDWLGWHREVFPHYFVLINDYYLVLSKFEDNWAWAPQHTLPAVLGACFVIETFLSKTTNRSELVLMLLATMYWSPLASIGLFPFVLFFFLKDFQTLLELPRISELIWIVGLVIAFSPLMIYFISTEGVNNGNTGFVWNSGTPWWWVYYAVYVFANVGIWFFFLRRSPFEWSRLIYGSMIFMILLGIYKIGLYNDLNVRGVIPAYTIMSIGIAVWVINGWLNKRVGAYFLAMYLLLGGLQSIRNFWLQGINTDGPQTTIQKPFIGHYNSMLSFQESAYGDSTALKEYCLKKGGFFDKYLLKK